MVKKRRIHIHKALRFSKRQMLIFALAFGLIGGLFLWKSFAAPNPNLPSDLNNDNTVNVLDLSILLSNYSTTSSTADVNTDGTVNVLDLSILLSNYGNSVSSPATSSIGTIRLNYEQTAYLDHMASYSTVALQSYMRDKVAGIRAQNPNIKILMYFESSGVTDPQDSTHDWQWPTGLPYLQTKANNPGWFLKDVSGNDIKFWTYLHLMDVSNMAYADAWAQEAIDTAKSGGFDGILMDDVNFGETFRPGWSASSSTYNTDLKWTQAVEAFLNRVSPKIHAAGLSIVPNVGSEWNSDMATSLRWAQIAGGYNREHFLKWDETSTNPDVFTGSGWTWMTNLERQTEGAGVPFYAATYGPQYGDEASMTYARCSYLLFWNPSSGGSFLWLTPQESTTDLEPYNTAWAFELGNPLGSATQSGSVWTRSFQNGTCTVDTATGMSTVR